MLSIFLLFVSILFPSSTATISMRVPTNANVSIFSGFSLSYLFDEWSAWSTCSSTCGEGFTIRRRLCLKQLLNNTSGNRHNEIVSNMDWLCGQDIDTFQVEKCQLTKCNIYSQWTEWSVCSRLCGGWQTRTRICNMASTRNLCAPEYLFQNVACGLDNCHHSIVTKLEQTEKYNTITKKGYLRLRNVERIRDIRLFTQTANVSHIQRVGVVVCRELSFSGLVRVQAVLASNVLRTQFVNEAYLQYINNQCLNGLSCRGDEARLVECRSTNDAQLVTQLFELEIECWHDGYWSDWSAWSTCSPKCGTGVLVRTRECNSPRPSVSDVRNGSDCTGKDFERSTCETNLKCNLD